MTSVLPLFPLGTVLFPGLVLPLHVFEERYRTLVRRVMALPEGTAREFGVVAIRRGWEAGTDSTQLSLFDIGCTAQIRQVAEQPDGTFDLVTVGRERFEITRPVPADTPYQQAEVRFLPEPEDADDTADRLAPGVLAAFREYLRLTRTDGEDPDEQLPDDPLVLSYLVAATAALTIDERQHLLAVPDTAGRLGAELRLLNREASLLRQIRAVPVPLTELPVRPGPN